MPRKRMVTRTIKSTQVSVMCVDTIAGETLTQTYNISGIFKDDNALLKLLKKENETDTVKLVAIVDKTVTDKYMGMTEQEFLTHAHEITKKEADEN